ncbi:MAG: urease accessory protein UreF [Oscillospiraceae bacterium]
MRTVIFTSIRIVAMNINCGFLKVIQSFDSLFPIGAFTMSNGLETYVQNGVICDEKSLREYLSAYSAVLPTSDLGFAAAAASGIPFVDLDEIYAAVRSPSELREGSRKLCKRLIKTQSELGQYPKLSEYGNAIESGLCFGSYPVAVGLFISDTETELQTALNMYCYSLLSQAVNHAVKLVPLSQIAGQRCLNDMLERIPLICVKAEGVSMEELGIGGCGFDLRSMQHEVLYSRMYIS